jgi:endonuclease/exonuclease/phosphatase family metal-dependent hydrolase
VFAKCPPQRIDHIFFSQGAPFEVRACAPQKLTQVALTRRPDPQVTEARRRFDDACVKAGKHMVTISDHFGISATIRAKRTEEGL